MASPLFTFSAVRVVRGDVEALAGIDLVIDDAAAVTCLRGPSGSGKSTLLRLCNRLEVPTQGAIHFRGRDLADVDVLAHRRTVGMVFQRPTLFPGTIADNLREADGDATEDAMVAALSRAALPAAFLSRDGAGLSGGEQQRACIARSLLTGPEVLLMDEPTSALDPEATRSIEDLALELTDAGTSVLWVTHDPAQADRLGTRCVVLDDGRVVTSTAEEGVDER